MWQFPIRYEFFGRWFVLQQGETPIQQSIQSSPFTQCNVSKGGCWASVLCYVPAPRTAAAALPPQDAQPAFRHQCLGPLSIASGSIEGYCGGLIELRIRASERLNLESGGNRGWRPVTGLEWAAWQPHSRQLKSAVDRLTRPTCNLRGVCTVRSWPNSVGNRSRVGRQKPALIFRASFMYERANVLSRM